MTISLILTLLFSSYSLSLSLSLSQKVIFSLSLSLSYYLFSLAMYFRLMNIQLLIIVFLYSTILGKYDLLVCFLSFPSQVFSLPIIIFVWFLLNIIFSYFGSENLNLYQNKILAIYLNMPINYLSNIKFFFFQAFIIMIISFTRMWNLNNIFET